jgi:transcriptional regulator with XRE-family HTH domain
MRRTASVFHLDDILMREQGESRAMYTHPQRRTAKLTQKLRQEAGRWLRDLREKRGLSQRELAQKVGAEYYTFISQLENGRGRIPPDRYLVWARALGADPREFVQGLMSYYDPVTYDIIFGRESRPEGSGTNASRPIRTGGPRR